jgi:twitching motility protein PilT
MCTGGADLHAMGNERPRPPIDSLLQMLWSVGGTDLLLTVGAPPLLRISGELQSADADPLTADDTEALLAEVLTEEQQAAWKGLREFDFSFSWRDEARIRGNAYTQRGVTAVALRMIPRTIPSMEELGLPEALARFARQHQGLILLTGPTGAGKSTSLASAIDLINRERSCHIVTVEDPIEYIHEHKNSVVDQREVGVDTASFADALRAVLREDPDVLLVGEMRDPDSIRFALTIAETGHLVFATLHTNDAAQSVSRLIDVFPSDQQSQIQVQLAAALSCVVYQRLVPRIGGGMVGAFEVLVVTPAVRNLIKDGKSHQLRNALLTGSRDGMITLEQSLSQLVQAGVITLEDAQARSLYPREIDPRPRVRGTVVA